MKTLTFAPRTAKKVILVATIFFVWTALPAQTRPPVAEQLAKTYGLGSFDQIEAIRYTFNLQWPGLNLVRTWTWEPKSNKVTFEGKDKTGNPVKVTYVRSQLDTQSEQIRNEVDPGFVNDQYWLVFPFHVYWDTGADVQEVPSPKLASGKAATKRVVVKYSSGGYTPGDTWDLTLGPDDRVQKLVFHHGGTTKPSLVVATWAGYKSAGPLLISTEHRGTADGKPLHLFFSNVAVKLSGSDTWISAQ